MASGDYMSEVMNKILDSLGLDEESRLRRKKVQIVGQFLSTCYQSLYDSSVVELYAGSSFETTTVEGLSSDIDRLMIFKDYRVLQRIDQWKKDLSTVQFMADDEDCYKSYVKLYLLSPHYPGPIYEDIARFIPTDCVVDKDGKIYYSSQFFIEKMNIALRSQSHGPAISPENLHINEDFVIAFRCEFYPRSALRWKERQTAETLARVGESIINEANHCYVVAIGNKSSAKAHLEWRYSFTHLERRLVHAWNNVQYKLYVMMKFILKDLIQPFVPDVISSYHIKTILFWMNEEYTREFFEATNFNQCILTYLKNILDTVKSKSLNHYFIEGCDLYHNKMNDATSRQMTHIIQAILDNWPQSLYDIKRRNLGSKFYFVLSGITSLPTMCDLVNKERGSKSRFEMPTEFKHLFQIVNESKENFNKECMSEVQSHLKVVNREVKKVTFDTEIINFVNGMISDVQCNFAIHLLIKNSILNESELSSVAMAVTHIQTYVNDCYIDTRLKVAAFMVFTGDFQGGTVLLDRIACQMKPYTVHTCYHDSCTNNCYTSCIRVIHNNKPTLSEFIAHYFAQPVEYEREMIGHLPKAFVYEMFRSTSASPPPSHRFDDFKWHQHAIIQSSMFLDFLRYVIAKSQSLYDESKVAIENMKRSSELLAKARTTHSETNHNVIGHCHKERNDTQRAFAEYKKSMTIKKHHNAALWHIAVLLRQHIRGGQ